MTNFKNIDAYSKRNGREIFVCGVKWKWSVGSSFVVAYSEKGEKRTSGVAEVKGISNENWERGKWKRTRDGMLKPSDVERWLST